MGGIKLGNLGTDEWFTDVSARHLGKDLIAVADVGIGGARGRKSAFDVPSVHDRLASIDGDAHTKLCLSGLERLADAPGAFGGVTLSDAKSLSCIGPEYAKGGLTLDYASVFGQADIHTSKALVALGIDESASRNLISLSGAADIGIGSRSHEPAIGALRAPAAPYFMNSEVSPLPLLTASLDTSSSLSRLSENVAHLVRVVDERRPVMVPAIAPVVRTDVRGVSACALVRKFERRFRIFVEREFTARFGPGWERLRVSGEVLDEWKRRRDEATAADELRHGLIWFAELGDYIAFIGRKDNWRDVFKAVFHHRDDVSVSLRRIIQLRRPGMHSRKVAERHLRELRVEVDRLTRSIRRASRRLAAPSN